MTKFLNYIIKTHKMKKRIHWRRLLLDAAFTLSCFSIEILPVLILWHNTIFLKTKLTELDTLNITGELRSWTNTKVEFYIIAIIIYTVLIFFAWSKFQDSIIKTFYKGLITKIENEYTYYS